MKSWGEALPDTEGREIAARIDARAVGVTLGGDLPVSAGAMSQKLPGL